MQPNPNNNLSVLPWYRSLDEQNARRWWVYGRVYPLFSTSRTLLPFQIMRDTLETVEQTGPALVQEWSETGFIDRTGVFVEEVGVVAEVASYGVVGMSYVWFDHLACSPDAGGCSASALDYNGNILATFTPEYDEEGYFTGYWKLPAGTTHILAQVYNDENTGALWTCSTFEAVETIAPVTLVEIYKKDGTVVGDYTSDVNEFITIKAFSGFDVIVFAPGESDVFAALENGQYYAKLSDGTNTWYSEVFTVVNDLAPYLKIVWYDQTDFVMDAGTIVYTEPSFRNVLYLDSTLAKPEYPFEEEGENRDGYFFPVKQISEKRYRFKFFASEYLLDVMRFIRMADYAFVEYLGKTYTLDTFLITPEWEANGDVASVEAVFDTDTVAKKIGVGYIKATE